MRSLLIVCCQLVLLLASGKAYCQANPDTDRIIDTGRDLKIRTTGPSRIYLSNGLDFPILSTSFNKTDGEDIKITVPRFTLVFNFGFHFNYDLSRNLGLFTGIGIKNIGYIEKTDDVTIKRRVYTAGVPIGLKIGNLRDRDYVFFGGGVDLPFNYREKAFTKRSSKQKFSESFSDHTARVMPYVFAGMSFNPGITMKLQYYPGNFLNTSFADDPEAGPPNVPSQPYAGRQVHLLLLTAGIDIRYNQYKIQEREYRRQKEAATAR